MSQRWYAVGSDLYDTLDEAIEAAQYPGDVLVLEDIGYLDDLAQSGEIPTDGDAR